MSNININDNVAHPLAKFRNHLEFNGFHVDEEEDVILCRHPRKYNMLIRNVPERGVLISVLYTVNDNIKRVDLLEYLNQINMEILFSKTYVDEENNFILDTFFEGDYDRSNFSLILENIEADLSFIGEHPDTEKFLG
ncbi:MAG: hypothetical protein N5P05_000106 [Chroococcopsis gigantea SAG 12.99]|jgi:hypothetical protein|nr:hypothetical protein [Chlorogloea purpurea SAG 13.99]MDV2998500.1 hypothetical protein [Chroococcopsis gigantea SAG 12.99]